MKRAIVCFLCLLTVVVVNATEKTYLTKELISSQKSYWRILNDKGVQGKPISVGKKVYARGLGVHANSELIYTLNGGFDTFHVVAGPDDANGGTIEMKILVDDKEVYNSGKVNSRTFQAKELNINVKGAKKLTLIVNDIDNNKGGDHGSWADAYLTGKGRFTIKLDKNNLPAALRAETQGAWWMKRHLEKVKEAKKGDVDLVLIGDSITHYWEREPNYSYFFGGRKALNLGFGGDCTQNVLWRLNNGEIDGINPKLVTLMIGTNNSGRFKAEDTFAGIKKIVETLQVKLPNSKILLVSILPRGVKKNNDDNMAVNRLLPTLVDNKKVFYLDVTDKFLNADNSLNMKLYWRDGVHLIAKGYEVWGRAMEDFISKVLNDEKRDGEIIRATLATPTDGPRHQEKCEEVKSGNQELIFIGDSITHFFDRDGDWGIPVWNKYYKHRKALNLGFGGNTTDNVIWRLENGEIDGLNPKLAVIMIGTNNTHVKKDKPEDTFAGIKKIVDVLRKRLPNCKVLVLSIFPRGVNANDPLRKINEEVNAKLPSLADNKMVYHLDINKAFLNENGVLSREIMPDLVHPNTKGYEIWAEAMEPTLKKLLNE